MRSFKRDENGFILIFSLLLLPVFFGFGLLLIDVGRGNNAHADLAAADSLALAGARELDGGSDAIPRAKAAMANLTNTVSMLGRSAPDMEIELVYVDVANNEFSVAFLDDIPELDTTPIDAAYIAAHRTSVGAEAKYVYVRAKSQNLITAFFNPANMLPGSIPVAATAVAKSVSAACDIPPLYICNPFEYDSAGNYVGDLLQSNFEAGNLHGRLIKLHPKGSGTHEPGNFGFLSVNGSSSADAIRDIFAGNRNPTCYDSSTVTTKPGAATSISQGINTRFDIYTGPFNNWNPSGPNSFDIAPAVNVRKGIRPDARVTGGTIRIDDCVAQGSSGTPGDDHLMDATGVFNANGVDDLTYGLADNNVMIHPNDDTGAGIAGAFIGNGEWRINDYLTENYATPPLVSAIPSSFPGNLPGGLGASTPSRYDVYRYEISSGIYTQRAPGEMLGGAPSGESGAALCGPSSTHPINPVSEPDRRIVVAAIIDCGEAPESGGVNTYPVNSYASLFLTRPMVSAGPGVDSTIDVEIVDITGYGGNGTLETFIREEAILVR